MEVSEIELDTRSLDRSNVPATEESETASRSLPSAPQQQTDHVLLDSEEHQVDFSEHNRDGDCGTSLPRGYPYWRGKPIYDGNQEAFGWALDTAGRSIAFVSAGAFLATALLKLAKEAAGCETEPPPGENEVPECNERIYGIRPSSLLTTYTIVIGLLSSILMPLMGAVVDYMDYRLKIGRITTIVWCVALFPSIFLASETWLAIAISVVIISLVGWAQTMITYAYLPELTDDRQLLNKYTSNFSVIQYSSMVLFLIFVLGLATAIGISDDDIATARMSQLFSFVFSSITLVYAWMFLFRYRPAAHELPEGQSVWTAGFRQVVRTSKKIYRHYNALKWFYIAVAFSEAAIQSLATIAITYLSDQLAFTSSENGIVILIMLIGAVPGGVAAAWATTRLKSPIWSSLISVAILFTNTLAAGLILKEPGQQLETYIIAGIWGIGTGWKWTTDRLLSSTIIPEGQDAELMGMFLFAGQILTWLPPLIYTGLNEVGVEQRIGIICLNMFYLLAGIGYLMMGSYDDAVAVAGRTARVAPPDDLQRTDQSGSSDSSSAGMKQSTAERAETDNDASEAF